MNPKRPDKDDHFLQTSSLPVMANNNYVTPFSPGRPENKGEKWIQEEFRKHMAIEHAITIETQSAHDATAFLYMYSSAIFVKAAGYIFEIKETNEIDALQPYVDKFCKRALEDLATRQFGINDVAVANIAYTVHREHYPPEFEEGKKGWLSKLFG